MYGILRGKKKLVIPKSFPQCAAELLSCFVLIGKGQDWSDTGFKSGDCRYKLFKNTEGTALCDRRYCYQSDNIFTFREF